MIVFINGAFGVGKTTIAEQLVAQLPNSMLYDPEEVGFFLRNIVQPIEQFEDFQDLTMWRTLVVTTAQLLKETYGRTLVMPMTIWYQPYFNEIMSGLRQIDPRLYHFCLIAKKETLMERLQSRYNSPDALAWCLQRIERCVNAFQLPAFAVQVETDAKTPEEIKAEIMSRIAHQPSCFLL